MSRSNQKSGTNGKGGALSAAIRAGDATAAKAELRSRVKQHSHASAAELACFYADGVKELLSGGQQAHRLLFPDAKTVGFYLELLTDELCAQAKSAARGEDDETAILAFVDEHIFAPELSLSFVAERFARGASFVSALFRQKKGMKYVDYVNGIRTMRAAELLRTEEPGNSLDAIRLAVGYVSQSTFRRNFVKYMGCTPTQYRLRRTR